MPVAASNVLAFGLLFLGIVFVVGGIAALVLVDAPRRVLERIRRPHGGASEATDGERA